jgi:hypothetical protein
MAEFDEVVKQAQALGQTLAGHPRVKAYITAQGGVHRDAAARTLLSDYDRHVQRVHSLEVAERHGEQRSPQAAHADAGRLPRADEPRA